MSTHKLPTVRAAGLEQMDAHMNKLQRSKHSKHSSLPAWPHHTKCYSSHIEEYNENITLGERCCARSKGWQMDGSGNMLQHPRPATTLAELNDTQVSTTGELMLPTLTQLLQWTPACTGRIFLPYMLSYQIALLAPRWLTPTVQLVNSTARDSLYQPSQRSLQSASLPSYSSAAGPGS